MNNYKTIPFENYKKILKDIDLTNDFLSESQISDLKKSIEIKKQFEELGYKISHYKKIKPTTEEQHQGDAAYVFRVQKDFFTYTDIGNTFYEPIFKMYAWLKREINDHC